MRWDVETEEQVKKLAATGLHYAGCIVQPAAKGAYVAAASASVAKPETEHAAKFEPGNRAAGRSRVRCGAR